jgi:hypothetical protein
MDNDRTKAIFDALAASSGKTGELMRTVSAVMNSMGGAILPLAPLAAPPYRAISVEERPSWRATSII